MGGIKKHQIPKSKSQIKNKHPTPTGAHQAQSMFGVWKSALPGSFGIAVTLQQKATKRTKAVSEARRYWQSSDASAARLRFLLLFPH